MSTFILLVHFLDRVFGYYQLFCRFYLLSKSAVLLRCSVRIEERQILEVYDVLAVSRLAFCEDRELADDLSADCLHELLESREGFTRADHVIDYQGALALYLLSLVPAQAERLHMVCSDRIDLDLDNVLHVKLGALARYDVRLSRLAGHLIAKRDPLALGGDESEVLWRLLR